MSKKDVLKSPLFLTATGLCILLAGLLLYCVIKLQAPDEASGVGISPGTSSESYSLDAVIEPLGDTALDEEKAAGTKNTEDFSSNSSSGTASASGSSETGSMGKTNADAAESKYVSKSAVKEIVLTDSCLTESLVNFISLELDESQDPPVYDVVFESNNGYRKYLYKVNALTGLCRWRTYYNADNKEDEENIFLGTDGDWDEWTEKAPYIYWDPGCYPSSSDQSFYDGIPIIPYE